MALTHSSSIVTDGLAFTYDSYNRKSYAGPPITNKTTTISTAGIGGSAGSGYLATEGTELVNIPQIGPTLVKYVNIQNNYTAYTPTTNNCCPSLFQYGGYPVTGSTLYTYGIVYKCHSEYTSSNYMYRYEYNGGTYVTEAGVHTTSQRVHLGGGWYWAWATFTTQPTTTQILSSGLWYYRYSPVADKISVAKILVVQGDYTALHPKYWPDSNVTRSNTEAIKDIAGNTSIAATSLTYANNGTFSFTGGDYLTIPTVNLGNGNMAWTVSAWVKTTTTVNALGAGSVMSNSSGGPVYSMMGVNAGKIVYWTYQNSAWAQKLGVGKNVNDNVWHHLTWVNYTSNTMDMYVDGVLDSTVANSTSGNNNPVDRIGGSWSAQFVGSIASVSRYTRALSSTEVFQNFNALRGRYGV